eukprot:1164150-Amphidinium_carterae.1
MIALDVFSILFNWAIAERRCGWICCVLKSLGLVKVQPLLCKRRGGVAFERIPQAGALKRLTLVGVVLLLAIVVFAMPWMCWAYFLHVKSHSCSQCHCAK